MRLLAISDLHVNHRGQRDALEALPVHADDWLIVAGDVAERAEDLAWTLDVLGERFARLFWVPGNHELWTTDDGLRGQAKYEALVDLCRERGVLTPEDDYVRWPGDGPPTVICPLFLLYDYTFGPDGLGPEATVAWAAEARIRCADEVLLAPDPFPSRQAWCAHRLETTAARLDALPDEVHTVLINHWTFREDLVRLWRIPRFVPWCGTRATEDWHTRYRARVCVSGHLHMRATDWRDGVRFEEVALGYPRHWRQAKGVEGYLREILPGPARRPPLARWGPIWHR